MSITQLSINTRPRQFKDLYGLEVIKKEWTIRSKKRDFPNAILIKGPFGTGKTTLAQIIASSIQCSNPSDGEPCCECSSCKSIINETFDEDTIRLDGGTASKDDVIDLILTEVKNKPLYNNKKVIIIEEADQLSEKAKNALLKTLEKPVSHVTFILLSMTKSGVSSAIQSRCQVYNIKPFLFNEIMLYLKKTLEDLNLWTNPDILKEFKTKGLLLIAKNSEGSLRQALQSLEKCLKGEFYTEEQILNELGIIDDDSIVETLEKLLTLNKNVWDSIISFEPLEFFLISYKIITDAKIYKYTKWAEQEWQISNFERLIKHSTFDTLFDSFTELNLTSKPYIRKPELLNKLVCYFEKCTRKIESSKYVSSDEKAIINNFKNGDTKIETQSLRIRKV